MNRYHVARSLSGWPCLVVLIALAVPLVVVPGALWIVAEKWLTTGLDIVQPALKRLRNWIEGR